MDLQSLLGAAPQKAPVSNGAALAQQQGETATAAFALPEAEDAAVVDGDLSLELPGLPTEVQLLAQTAVLTSQTQTTALVTVSAEVTVSVDVPDLGSATEPSMGEDDVTALAAIPTGAPVGEDAVEDGESAETALTALPTDGEVPPPALAVSGPTAPVGTGEVVAEKSAPLVAARGDVVAAPIAAPTERNPVMPAAPDGPKLAPQTTELAVPRGVPPAPTQALPQAEAMPQPATEPSPIITDAKPAAPNVTTAATPQAGPVQPAPMLREAPPAAIPLPPSAVAAPDVARRTPAIPEIPTEEQPAQPRDVRGETLRTAPELAPTTKPQIADPAAPPPQPTQTQGAQLAPEMPAKPVTDTAISGDLAKFVEIAPAADIRGSQSTLSTQAPGTTMAPEPLRPPTLQIVEALRLAPGTVDLVLVPEELGRLTLSMAMEDGSMAVTVSAERPETLDLVRRNATLLEAEARAAGFDNVSFTFSEQGSNGGHDANDADGKAPGSGDGPALPGRDGLAEPDVTALPVSGSLDLRL